MVRHSDSPINDVEVVTVIPLINDMFPSFNQLFKHRIQHLRHLFLFKRTQTKTRNYHLFLKILLFKSTFQPHKYADKA